MRSLLITGASGFLGGYACRLLSPYWQIWGTHNTQPVTLPTGDSIALDLTHEPSIDAVWQRVKPDAVIHTAALSKASQCQQFPDRSYRVNVLGAVHLANRCARHAVPLIFTSTDLVFNGTTPPYDEAALPAPLNTYGRHKALAETQILAAYPEATVCRLPLLFGPQTPTATCFLQNFLATITAGQPLTLFTDEIRTPAAVTDVVQGLRLALEQNLTGLLHLGGPQRLSRYEFGLLMADSFGLPTAALTPCRQSAIALVTPRPPDVSLNSQKAFALGYAPQNMETALRAIADASHLTSAFEACCC
ncbi:MAG: SDR family oxidoreductase [Leptolyngbyaceae cyanobacterium]